MQPRLAAVGSGQPLPRYRSPLRGSRRGIREIPARRREAEGSKASTDCWAIRAGPGTNYRLITGPVRRARTDTL